MAENVVDSLEPALHKTVVQLPRNVESESPLVELCLADVHGLERQEDELGAEEERKEALGAMSTSGAE